MWDLTVGNFSQPTGIPAGSMRPQSIPQLGQIFTAEFVLDTFSKFYNISKSLKKNRKLVEIVENRTGEENLGGNSKFGELACNRMGFGGLEYIGLESGYKSFMARKKLPYEYDSKANGQCLPDYSISGGRCKKARVAIICFFNPKFHHTIFLDVLTRILLKFKLVGNVCVFV